MGTVTADETDESNGSEIFHHKLSEPLGTTHVAINYYRLAPEEGLPGGLHTHMDQEEVFVVFEGDATFETYPPLGDENRIGDEIVVGEGETVRFAPGEFQSGANESDEELVLLAIGAPRDSQDVRLPLYCPECGHGELRLQVTDDGLLFVCPDCGSERIPDPCPACGDDDMRVTLGDDCRPVVVCDGCGAAFDTAPTTRLSGGTE